MSKKGGLIAAFCLVEVFPCPFLFPRTLRPLYVFLQARQQLGCDKLLFRGVATQLLVFLDSYVVGKQMIRRKVLEGPPAQAALDLIFPDGFLGFHDKAALRVFLFRGGSFGFRHVLIGKALLGGKLFHPHQGELVVRLNESRLKRSKLVNDKRSRLFWVSVHYQLKKFGIGNHFYSYVENSISLFFIYNRQFFINSFYRARIR